MDYGGNDGSGAGGYGSPSPSTPGGSSRTRKGYDEQNLVPVTIRMVLNAEMPSCILADGREPHQVKLVAAVRESTPGSTNIMYTVEDGTGKIDVKEWVDSDSDNTAIVKLRERAQNDSTYVRIIGKITEYEGRKEIIGYSVRPVSSGNELTHHFLEVVHSAEKFKSGNQIVGAPTNYGAGMNTSGMGFGGNGIQPQSVTPVKQHGMTENSGNDIKKALFDYFSNNSAPSDVGTPLLPFIQQTSATYTESQIRQAVTDMSSEGMLYSTIDENYYNLV